MKFVFAILLTINGLAAFAQHTIKTDSVYISGKVRGYEKYNDTSNAVIFIITDIVFGRQINFRAKLNNDGTYKIAFLKTGTQDIYISFNENLETIIVSPGDHLQVSFEAGSIGTTLSFGGDNAQTNRDFERYTSALNKENIKLYGNDHDARFYALAASEKDAL